MEKKYKEIRNNSGNIECIKTSLSGSKLLVSPRLNKGTAFTVEERGKFGLLGKLPLHIETIEEQVDRIYAQYSQKESALQKNIFLNVVHDTNETLFYRLVSEHLEEMLPIIYTPTVGEAVQKFSLQLRRPRGLFISYPDRDRIEEILDNYIDNNIDIIVATDGEGVLGIGDQGIGGMNISIAKLMVYTLCAGIHPFRTLPIQLDVGTNNPLLINDPMYLGWKHERIFGTEYDKFINKFVEAVKKKLPGTFLHWEDFGRDNARKNLDIYRNNICSFNDDIQGTGAVALAAVLAAIKSSGQPIEKHKIVIFGAGTAGAGIADQIYDAMCRHGMSKKDARNRFYLIDRDGLLTDDMPNLLSFQEEYAHSKEEVSCWDLEQSDKIMLKDVVRNVKPTVLIGCSTVTGAFNRDLIKEMYKHVKHPIIMPLSNPTSKAEAHPKNLYEWTDGNALIATGSPFGTVSYKEKDIRVSQCNNALIFPGIGLGVLISKAGKVTDNMLWVASRTLSEASPIGADNTSPILPGFDNIDELSKKIATEVAKQAVADGVAGDIEKDIDFEYKTVINTWEPKYYPYERIN